MGRYKVGDNWPAHFRLAPSSSKRWIPCTHSQWAPEGEPHPTAAAGNATHHLCDEWLSDPSPFKVTLPLEQAAYRLSLEHVEHDLAAPIAATAPQYVQTVMGIEGDLYTETKIKHDWIDDFGGTLDTLRVTDDALHIVDMKTGKWPVYPTDPQLKCYAILARQEFPDRDIFVTVVQPRAFREPQTTQLLPRILDKFEEKVAAVADDDTAVPGEYCRFCPLRPECKPGRQYARHAGW